MAGQGQSLHLEMAAALPWVSATGLLQITQGLLAQAAVMTTCPHLQQLMQGIGKIADLQGCHRTSLA